MCVSQASRRHVRSLCTALYVGLTLVLSNPWLRTVLRTYVSDPELSTNKNGDTLIDDRL